MSKVSIIAIIVTKADKVDPVKAEMLKLVAKSRSEAGCINCTLHQDNENSTYFLFYENWASRELWMKHTESQHLLDFVLAAQDLIVEFSVHEMTQLRVPCARIDAIENSVCMK